MDGATQGGRLSPKPGKAKDLRMVLRIVMLSAPLTLGTCALLPNVGPVLRVFSIPSGAMIPTLRPGSHVVISRLSYGYARHSFDWLDLPIEGRWPQRSPERGDIVVFRLPRDQTIFYVKRLIGLPGDEIQMKDGVLHINGVAVPKVPKGTVPLPYSWTGTATLFEETLPSGVSYSVLDSDPKGHYDDTRVLKVPAGHVLMMGDNRDNSTDSRVPAQIGGVGFVPIELLLGKVVWRIPSFDADQE